MFRIFTLSSDPNQTRENVARALFRKHPADLAALLDLAWSFQIKNPLQPLGHPDHRSDLEALAQGFLNLFPTTVINTGTGNEGEDLLDNTVRWDHLIYAYMIENTRILEVFRRVVHELVHGEQLGVPDRDGQFWLRNTEELFFTDQPLFYITHLTSHMRQDFCRPEGSLLPYVCDGSDPRQRQQHDLPVHQGENRQHRFCRHL
jgi:hypothetical protein